MDELIDTVGRRLVQSVDGYTRQVQSVDGYTRQVQSVGCSVGTS